MNGLSYHHKAIVLTFNAGNAHAQGSGQCLVLHSSMSHYLCIDSRITITQLHTMQRTHTHKAVTKRIEAKVNLYLYIL